jgi:hypothetical protein
MERVKDAQLQGRWLSAGFRSERCQIMPHTSSVISQDFEGNMTMNHGHKRAVCISCSMLLLPLSMAAAQTSKDPCDQGCARDLKIACRSWDIGIELPSPIRPIRLLQPKVSKQLWQMEDFRKFFPEFSWRWLLPNTFAPV